MDTRTLVTGAAVVIGLGAIVTVAIEINRLADDFDRAIVAFERLADDLHRGVDIFERFTQALRTGDSPIRVRGGSVMVGAGSNWTCNPPATHCVTNIPLNTPLFFTSSNTVPLISSRTPLPANWMVRVDTMPYNTAHGKASPGTISIHALNANQVQVISSRSLTKGTVPWLNFSDSSCGGCNFRLHTIHIANMDLDCTGGSCEVDIGP